MRVADFVFIIRNTMLMGGMKITPRNVLAFDVAHTAVGRMFIERHGTDKFARFVDLYDEYAKGKTTAQMMARELGVIRYEVELLLSDIRPVSGPATEIEHQSRRQQQGPGGDPAGIRQRLGIEAKSKLLVYPYKNAPIMKKLEVRGAERSLEAIYRKISSRRTRYGALNDIEINELVQKYRHGKDQSPG